MQSINFDEGIKTFSINGDEASVALRAKRN